MRQTSKTAHPVFILSVLLLIVNDWYCKATFHNTLTGKLSDFAGLFALPFLLGALWPKQVVKIHVGIALLFIAWKSELSQPLIQLVNAAGIPIGRTVDLTDTIALLSVLLSYRVLQINDTPSPKPALQKIMMALACMAFMATTLPPADQRKFVHIDKEYTFPFSKRELVSRLNMVQLKEVRDINKINGLVDFDSQTNTFHYKDKTDTLATLLDYTRVQDQDTIQLKTSLAEILISGTEKNYTLKLLTVYKFVPKFRDKDYREKAIAQFERQVIKEVRKFRK